jgi:hypothetical protein
VNHRKLAGPIVDLDGVAGGEIEQMGLGLFGEVEQGFCAGKAELCFQFLGPGALAGAELPAIAA